MSGSVRLGRNALDALFANGVGLVVSMLSVILLPSVATVEIFGYWQLYLLYSSFVYVASFGLNDGVYLRYAGRTFGDLNRSILAGQFRALVTASVSFGFLGCSLAYIMGDSSPVWLGVSILIPTLNTRSMLLYVLQATNQFRPYAACLIVDRGVFAVALAGILIVGPRLSWLIAADVIGKLLSLLVAVMFCWRLLRGRAAAAREVRGEIRANLAAGSRLMMAGLASMGTIGIIRIAIERGFGIEVFGRVSLLLSASHLLMAFITAFAQVVFPWLRTLAPSRLPQIYMTVRDSVALFGFAGMLAYWPLYSFVEAVLPEYVSVLPFLALQIPLIVYDSKILLLINTYSNTLRKENALMGINLTALLLSLLLALGFSYLLRDLFWTVASMLIVQVFIAVVGELYLASVLALRVVGPVLAELVLVLSFVLSMLFLGPAVGTGTYVVLLVVHILARRTAYLNVMRVLASALPGQRA